MPKDTSDNQANSAAPSRKWLFVALLLTFFWLAILCSLVVWTANPVTFNRHQIMISDRVVVATVSDIKQNGQYVIAVEQDILHHIQPKQLEQLTIIGHSALTIRQGEKYLMPLVAERGSRYRVTPTNLPDHPPLIYPATKESIVALKRQLAKWRNQTVLKKLTDEKAGHNTQ